MSSFIPQQETLGKAFSITGLALVGISTYFFRNYSRVLDYVQMFYVFASVYAIGTTVFSTNLYWSFITFMKSFIDNYCHTGEFLCTYGYLISPGISWFGVALLMLIILSIVACKKSHVRYHNFYIFWKGFFRWFSVPLTFYCTAQIITSAQSGKFDSKEVNFLAAAVIALLIFFWMFVELIGHKCAQKSEENTWKKWCDFISNFRIVSVVALVVVSLKIDPMAKYFIYGPIVIYDIVFLAKYKFNFKVFERIIFIIQEGVLITVFSLFIFKNQYVSKNNIDLLGLALVLLLEFLIFIPKLIAVCKNAEEEEDPAVYPEGNSGKKNNAFDLQPQASRANLNESQSPSPRGKRR